MQVRGCPRAGRRDRPVAAAIGRGRL